MTGSLSIFFKSSKSGLRNAFHSVMMTSASLPLTASIAEAANDTERSLP